MHACALLVFLSVLFLFSCLSLIFVRFLNNFRILVCFFPVLKVGNLVWYLFSSHIQSVSLAF